MKIGKEKKQQSTSLEFSVEFEGFYSLSGLDYVYIYPHYYNNGVWYWVNKDNEVQQINHKISKQKDILNEILDMHKKLSLVDKLED